MIDVSGAKNREKNTVEKWRFWTPQFSFITSNKWFRAAYGEPLRGWLARHARLHQIIDFGDAPVFTTIAYPCIVILTKEEQVQQDEANGQPARQVHVLHWQPGPSVEQFIEVFQQQSFTLPQTSLKPDGWQLESSTKLKLLGHIRAAGTPLGEYVKGRFYYGIKTGLNEAFVIDRTTRDRLLAEHPSSQEIIKPILRGRDVKRWRVEFADHYLIKIESSENKQHLWSGKSVSEAEKFFAKTYPAIYEHFKPLRSALVERYDQGKYFWELRACAYWQEFERPKIIYPDIARDCEFAVDDSSLFLDCTLFLIPGGSLFLAGILNSNVVRWFFPQICPTIRGDFLRFKSIYVSEIPIPQATLEQTSSMSQLVEYLLWLNSSGSIGNQHPASARDPLMSGYFEQLLNGLVYELFFPDELHAQKLFLFHYVEEAKLPVLSEIPEAQRLAVLRETFERIYDLHHPIRGCLFSLGSLETVRIIEGEA